MTAPTLSDVELDAVMLASMIEGLGVLIDAAGNPKSDPMTKAARNALPPIAEMTIARAWALAEHLDKLQRSEGA